MKSPARPSGIAGIPPEGRAGQVRALSAGSGPDAAVCSSYLCSLGSTSRPKTSIHSFWLRPTLCR